MIRWTVTLALLAGVPLGADGREKPAAKALDSLVRVLTVSDDLAVQRDVLRGMAEALQGRRNVAAPRGWTAVYRKLSASKDAEIREKALVLSVLFGDPQALADLRKIATDRKGEPDKRRGALQTLIEKRPADLLPVLRDLLTDGAMRGLALRGLAAYDDAGTPALILRWYARLTPTEKADAISTLASRPSYGLALLDAVERKQVARQDVPPFIARQLAALKDRKVTERLNKVWGSIKESGKDKTALLVRYKGLAKPEALKKANRQRGRVVFARTCATCHVLFGEGAKIGPDLTGSQRANPEYILSKVVDPNAVVARDYQVTMVTTRSGRVLTGLIKEENDKTLTLQTPTEVVRVPRRDIEQRSRLTASLMPEGMLGTLKDDEVRNLLAYLAGPGQVALPAEKKEEKPGPKRR
jgi:putative heme-binding domain-containing protein